MFVLGILAEPDRTRIYNSIPWHVLLSNGRNSQPKMMTHTLSPLLEMASRNQNLSSYLQMGNVNSEMNFDMFMPSCEEDDL